LVEISKGNMDGSIHHYHHTCTLPFSLSVTMMLPECMLE